MDQFIKSVDDLLSDNSSGSVDLLAALIRAVKDLVSRSGPAKEIDAVSVSEILIRIRLEKPLFFVLQHFISALLQLFQEGSTLASSRIEDFVNEYTSQWNQVNELISKNLLQKYDLEDKTILLHSNSSTIYGLFEVIADSKLAVKIIQAESRPVLEGRIQASRLADLGFQVTLITDASISRYMEQADLAILGADAVFPEYFINKSGSQSIALACREYGKSCLVVCDSRKLWLNQEKEITAAGFFDQPSPPNEVWNDPPSSLNIENLYFERTPNRLINWFVFEDKAVASPGINRLVR